MIKNIFNLFRSKKQQRAQSAPLNAGTAGVELAPNAFADPGYAVRREPKKTEAVNDKNYKSRAAFIKAKSRAAIQKESRRINRGNND